MNASMVTAASGTEAQDSGGGTAAVTPAPTRTPEVTAAPTEAPEVTETPEAVSTPGVQTDSLQNSITDAAAPVSGSGGDETLNEAQGLSLSTEGEETAPESGSEGVSGSRIAEYTISLTLSGLILLAAGSGVVYLFRKNWKKWGGGYEDDGDEEEE